MVGEVPPIGKVAADYGLKDPVERGQACGVIWVVDIVLLNDFSRHCGLKNNP